MTDEQLAVHVLFENWFKREYRWEMKRGVDLLNRTDTGQYVNMKTQVQFKSFKAAFEIAGVIKNV